MGLSGELIKTESLTLAYGVDALHPNDNTEYLNFGLELDYRKLIFIRGGLPSFYKQDKIEGPSFGVGMNYLINRTSTLLTIDYSLSDYGPLGEVKRLNIGFNF